MTWRRLLRHEVILALLVIVALFVLDRQSDRFFTLDNMFNQGRLMTEVGLVAIIMTFVIVTGGIDLSVGSILGMTAILIGVFWKNVGLPLPVAIGLGLVVGTFAGFVNGVVITRFRVPPLIATLGTLALYRGIAEGISQARSVRGYPEWFYVLGQGQVAGVPTQLWILGARRRHRGGGARMDDMGTDDICDRVERGRGALLGAQHRRDQDCHLLGLGPRGGGGGGDLRVAGLDDAV